MALDSSLITYDKPMTPTEAAMGFFRVHGWTPEQAAGIVGNLHFESAGLQPDILEGDKGPGYGLAQWTSPDRKSGLFEYAAAKGEKTPSFGTQLEYVQHELDTSQSKAGAALRNAKTIPDAAKIITDQYEIPAQPMYEKRIKAANNIISGLLSPTEADASVSPVSQPATTPTPKKQSLSSFENVSGARPPQPESASTDKMSLMAEAYKRGILPDNKKSVFEEAMRRGLVPKVQGVSSSQTKPAAVQSSGTDNLDMFQPFDEFPSGGDLVRDSSRVQGQINDDLELRSVPKAAPNWAHDHPDAYWNTIKAVEAIGPSTDMAAIITGAKVGAESGAAAGSIIPGAGTAVGGIVGGLTGAGLAYAIKEYGMDAVKQYLGMEAPYDLPEGIERGLENIVKGELYEAGGTVAGKAVGAVAGQVSKAAGPWTEKGFEALQKRAGDVLDQARGENPVYSANEAEAGKVASEIPGYQPSIGEMRNDPGLIKLQRGLQRQPGAAGDVIAQRQAESNRALHDYLTSEFTGNENLDDVIAALNQKKAGLGQTTEAAQGRLGPTVENLQKMEAQEAGGKARNLLQEAKSAEKGQVSSAYQQLGNPDLPISNTQKAIQKVESEFAPGEESVYPSTAVSRIKRALPKPNEQEFVVDPETGLTVAKDQAPEALGFQDLHSLRKDIGRQLRSATTGANPNLELARRLRILKDGIDADIEAGMGTDNGYTAAREAYGKYIQTFRKGAVGKSLQLGQEAEGFATPTASVTKRFWSPDGADGLIKAIGKDNASLIMEGHAVNDLETSGVIDKMTGEVNGNRLTAWMRRNQTVLDKYGITKNFQSVESAQAALDTARAEEAAFGKSIAAKMLNADPKQAMAAAMQGAEGISAKNTGAIMKNLLDQVNGNPDAVRGLKNSFKDFLIEKAETTAKDIHGGSVVSSASMTKTMSKYGEAMKVLYADEPSKLNALKRVQKAIEISNRSKFSPSGAGSDTAENIATQKATEILAGIAMRKIPGGGLLLGLAKHAGDYIKSLSKGQLNGILAKSMYDPDAAQTLVAISKGYIKKENVPSQMARIVTFGTIGVGRVIGDRRPMTPLQKF